MEAQVWFGDSTRAEKRWEERNLSDLLAAGGRSHLCATTMVVLSLQTLASEAWMFLSVWVSREDVACTGEPNNAAS